MLCFLGEVMLLSEILDDIKKNENWSKDDIIQHLEGVLTLLK